MLLQLAVLAMLIQGEQALNVGLVVRKLEIAIKQVAVAIPNAFLQHDAAALGVDGK